MPTLTRAGCIEAAPISRLNLCYNPNSYTSGGFEFTTSEGRMPVKGLRTVLYVTLGCFAAWPLFADIYEWTDENGVKHYTNYAPPSEAKTLLKTEELPYDEAADRARMEAERKVQLELARLELAEREAELEWREAQTEQRLAEAGRQAEETLREAEMILNEARNERYNNRNHGHTHYFRGYYPHHYRGRYFHRNKTSSIFYVRPPNSIHFKHYRLKKYHFGHDKKHSYKPYFGKKYSRKPGPRGDHGVHSYNRPHRHGFSNRSHGKIHTGRSHSGWGRSLSPSWRHSPSFSYKR
jgi:hypothetical protein